MATYCYSSADGAETIDREFPMGTAPKSVQHKGQRFDRDYRAEQIGRSAAHEKDRSGGNRFRPGIPHSGWGVMPFQRDEYQQDLLNRGLQTQVNEQGDPVFHSQREYDRFMGAMKDD